VADLASDASAASSPAADSGPVDELAALSATELSAWRMDGKLPKDRPATVVADDAASPAATAGEDPPASTDATPEPASEPAAEWTPARLKPETKKRFDALLTERTAAQQRADRAEARIRELEARQTQPATDTRVAASQTAPAGLVEPNPDDATLYPYGTSDPGWIKAMARFEAAEFIAHERAAFLAEQAEASARAERQRVIDGFNARLAQARLDPTFNEALALGPSAIPPQSLAEQWVIEDEAGLKILNHLQRPENAAEQRRILALDLKSQVKELVRLGDRLTDVASAARPASLDAPPSTLATRAKPMDVIEKAIREDDTVTYNREMNARELARIRGR
jgi:hypothetical protein